MVKRLIRLCATTLLFVLTVMAASAESVWIDEKWQHVSETVSCDGLPMIIDADIMQIDDGQTAQEYRTQCLDAAFAKQKAEEINWHLLDCQPGKDNWIQDGGSYYYSDTNRDAYFGIMTFCELDAVNRGATAQSPYRFVSADVQYDIDKSPLGTLVWSDVMSRAAQSASALGLQLGEPKYMMRCDDFIRQGQSLDESFEIWRQKYFPDLSEEEAEDIKTLEVVFPAYYQGHRLYSGTTFSLQGEAFIPQMNFDIQMHHSGSILKLFCPVYDEWIPDGIEAPVITGNNALKLLQAAYSAMYLPGISSVNVENAALEYTAISGDQTARKGFKIYPAWVFRITIVSEDDEMWERYVGFHAITGEHLF